MVKIRYIKIDPNIPDLTKDAGDACYDLRLSANNTFDKIAITQDGPLANRMILATGSVYHLRTGIALEIPLGYKAEVIPRSGLALRGFTIVNSPGQIDPSYRGELVVIGYILSGWLTFEMYERIAQLALVAIPDIDVILVEELGNTERGQKGFGSTGRL